MLSRHNNISFFGTAGEIKRKWLDKSAETKDPCEKESYLQQAEHWQRQAQRTNQRRREYA